MTHNYIVEDNINFWDELNNDGHEENEHDESDCCLLTKLPLATNFITLDCGHKFNYMPLFEEIKHQKASDIYNNYILFSRANQFYCPYCRKVINGLLPYIPSQVSDKVKYINYPSTLSIKHHNCSYVYKSGKNKGNTCNSNSGYETEHGVLCYKHHKNHKTIHETSTNETITHDKYFNNYDEYYKKYTVIQLKSILRKLSLPVTGNKQQLVERLIAHSSHTE